MGLNRYFSPELPTQGTVELVDDEAHHAIKVRREAVGNRCRLFDGKGAEVEGHVRSIGKNQLILEIEAYRFEPRELPGYVVLGVSMPKGDRQKDVVEKAVELGVHRLVPLLSTRSISLASDSHLEKWGRYGIEACKQCERNRLMEIASPVRFEAWIHEAVRMSSLDCQSLDSKPAENSGQQATNELRLIAHPKKALSLPQAATVELPSMEVRKFKAIRIAIGPEGGFTREEVQSAQDAGWEILDLGPRILRVETAVCVASILASRWLHSDRSYHE